MSRQRIEQTSQATSFYFGSRPFVEKSDPKPLVRFRPPDLLTYKDLGSYVSALDTGITVSTPRNYDYTISDTQIKTSSVRETTNGLDKSIVSFNVDFYHPFTLTNSIPMNEQSGLNWSETTDYAFLADKPPDVENVLFFNMTREVTVLFQCHMPIKDVGLLDVLQINGGTTPESNHILPYGWDLVDTSELKIQFAMGDTKAYFIQTDAGTFMCNSYRLSFVLWH